MGLSVGRLSAGTKCKGLSVGTKCKGLGVDD